MGFPTAAACLMKDQKRVPTLLARLWREGGHRSVNAARAGNNTYLLFVPLGLKRYQQARELCSRFRPH